jgi:hypothetical protein
VLTCHLGGNLSGLMNLLGTLAIVLGVMAAVFTSAVIIVSIAEHRLKRRQAANANQLPRCM